MSRSAHQAAFARAVADYNSLVTGERELARCYVTLLAEKVGVRLDYHEAQHLRFQRISDALHDSDEATLAA